MKEIYEFRIVEDLADRLFGSDEGKKLGSGFIRIVRIADDDPRLPEIGEVQKDVAQRFDKSFFHGWNIVRKYERAELAAAPLLHLAGVPVFEPAGEECGTKYDESTACRHCGAGAVQVSDLQLDVRKVPKGKHIARTIAGEWIVSQHLAERIVDANLSGFELRPVRHKSRYQNDPVDLDKVPTGRELIRKAESRGVQRSSGRFSVWVNRAENRPLFDQAQSEYGELQGTKARPPLPVWHQLIVTSCQAEIAPPTRTGVDPFDPDAGRQFHCPMGDSIGLNLLSEISISASTRGHNDVIGSRQYIGMRRGLLRPIRAILVSPKFWRLMQSEKIPGAKFEIAHLT